MMLALALDAPSLLPPLVPSTVNSFLPELCGLDKLGGASNALWGEVAMGAAMVGVVGVGCAIARSESND